MFYSKRMQVVFLPNPESQAMYRSFSHLCILDPQINESINRILTWTLTWPFTLPYKIWVLHCPFIIYFDSLRYVFDSCWVQVLAPQDYPSKVLRFYSDSLIMSEIFIHYQTDKRIFSSLFDVLFIIVTLNLGVLGLFRLGNFVTFAFFVGRHKIIILKK